MSTNRYSAAWALLSDADKTRLLGWAQQGEEFIDALVASNQRVSPSSHGFTVNTPADSIGDWTDDYERLATLTPVNAPPLPVLLGLTAAPDSPTLTWQALQQDTARRVVPGVIRSLVREWANNAAGFSSSTPTTENNRDVLMRQWWENRVQAFPYDQSQPAQRGSTPLATPTSTSRGIGGPVFLVLAFGAAFAIGAGRHKFTSSRGWTRFQRR